MPGSRYIVDLLPDLRQCYANYSSEREQKAFLHGKLGQSYREAEYCIIIVIDYLTYCGLVVTRKTLRDYLGDHVSRLDQGITRVLNSGSITEDMATGKFTIVPRNKPKPK